MHHAPGEYGLFCVVLNERTRTNIYYVRATALYYCTPSWVGVSQYRKWVEELKKKKPSLPAVDRPSLPAVDCCGQAQVACCGLLRTGSICLLWIGISLPAVEAQSACCGQVQCACMLWTGTVYLPAVGRHKKNVNILYGPAQTCAYTRRRT